MNKNFLSLVLFLVLLISVSAQEENLYIQDKLIIDLTISGEFQLKPSGENPQLEQVSAQLKLYPREDFRQTILQENTAGEVKNNTVIFNWEDHKFEIKTFSYQALIETNNEIIKVKTKIPFPLISPEIQDGEDYLSPTTIINSDDPKIIAIASELADGEDDLFKVVFKLADWVEGNIKYELNTLTAKASQTASWVLQNKQGVCDEMTSLFIAMARSLGIPARFVSGISYTTSELFIENWQPHGWAEVYFPTIGWVSFDITFGEYGYIDVTHVKLSESVDPTEGAVEFSWKSNNVQVETKPLQFYLHIEKKGTPVPEKIQLSSEILSNEVDLGSYNLVKGILKNTADYYLSTTLNLAVPESLEVVGRGRRNVLLAPKEVKETYWIIKISENLKSGYYYSFPLLIYSEKNVSVDSSFISREDTVFYTEKDISKLMITDEDKSYSRKTLFNCEYNQEIKLNTSAAVNCNLKNIGNTNLLDLKFCLNSDCKTIDLPINQQVEHSLTIDTSTTGWKKIIVRAENGDIEKKTSLEYVVIDDPDLKIAAGLPAQVAYGQPFSFNITLNKNSFSIPEDIALLLEEGSFRNEWQLEDLKNEHSIILNLENFPLKKENKFKITAAWKDKFNHSFYYNEEIVVQGQAKTILDRIKMFLNRIFY
ncbi:MAG TPA: transglutaminase domain-containing protein [Candidatus Nanoarchaeia archaeon]|nr:transglutaminase domain-containing protein [Candidatus Nanoarchaeia archaeon]